MNRKLKPFLALLVYSFSEGGKAQPEALETNPGHLSRSPQLPSCYVNDLSEPDCLFGVASVTTVFHLRSSCDTINFNGGDEFRSLGSLAAIAYSEGMLCSRKLSLFLILI